MHQCAERDNMDTSVIRHFVQEVSHCPEYPLCLQYTYSVKYCIGINYYVVFSMKILGIIAPPFSHEFATAILPLLHNEEIMQPLRNASDDEETIDMFIC